MFLLLSLIPYLPASFGFEQRWFESLDQTGNINQTVRQIKRKLCDDWNW